MKAKQKEDKMKTDFATQQAIKKENEEFDEYATAIVKEWKDAKKNIGPVLKTLERERPGYVKKRPGLMKKEMDHFSRLGFTARWIPVDATLPPIDG
jgi:hypothetical protein